MWWKCDDEVDSDSDVRKSTEALTSDDETESIAFFVQRHLHIFEHDPWALYSWGRKWTVQSSAKTLMLDQNI